MNSSPDEDAKLSNFLRQNRSIAQPGLPQLEDRLMAQIDLIPTQTQNQLSRSWQRYLIGGIGLVITGFMGATIFQLINPPEPSIAELNQLNLFLEAHADLSNQSELDLEHLVDLDPDPF
jgi:hypothetical protein